jgi:hypothetical protein
MIRTVISVALYLIGAAMFVRSAVIAERRASCVRDTGCSPRGSNPGLDFFAGLAFMLAACLVLA